MERELQEAGSAIRLQYSPNLLCKRWEEREVELEKSQLPRL